MRSSCPRRSSCISGWVKENFSAENMVSTKKSPHFAAGKSLYVSLEMVVTLHRFPPRACRSRATLFRSNGSKDTTGERPGITNPVTKNVIGAKVPQNAQIESWEAPPSDAVAPRLRLISVQERFTAGHGAHEASIKGLGRRSSRHAAARTHRPEEGELGCAVSCCL